jgi:hypothetical protein
MGEGKGMQLSTLRQKCKYLSTRGAIPDDEHEDAKYCVYREHEHAGFPETFTEHQKPNKIQPGNNEHLII